jgi:hypothetical protein
MAGDGRSVRRKGIAAVGVIAGLLLGMLVAFGLLGRGGGTAQAAGEIYLAPASSTGPNPFTASLMTRAAPALPPTPPSSEFTPPTAPQGEALPGSGAAPSKPRAAGTAPAAPSRAVPATALTSVDASVPQLYGGRMGDSPCDAGLLGRLLDRDSDVARAWAVAVGIDVDSVHDFVDKLVPVDLLDDVQVSDWRLVDGRGVAFQEVLQRGTELLVDPFGLPRVRCVSGDPLGLPDKVQRSARFVGERWESFRPATVIVIVPAAKALPTLVLLETTSGQPFGRPVGGGGRADIDSQTLVASQAQLGVVLNLPQQQSPDSVQDVRLSPSGGPPGSIVLAFGTGWPAGDRIRIEPCVGSRPETCALRTDAAVFIVVDPDGHFRAADLHLPGDGRLADAVLAAADIDGGFKGVQLHVPGDVRVSDYVEFYVQDLSDNHHARTFDAPWRVAGAECHDDCGAASGCHPPYCDSGADHHGCRCLVRTDPVCSFESCDGCPKDRCAARVREEPTPTARPPSNSSTRTSSGSGQQSGHGAGAQQFAGPGSSSSTTTASSSTGTQRTQSGQSTSTGSQTSQGTQTTRSQTTGQSSSRSTQQITQSQTSSRATQTTQSQTTTQSSSRATQTTPPPRQTATPTSAPPPPPPKQTATPTSAPPPPPRQTASPTSAPPPPPRQTASPSSSPPSKPTASPAPPPPPRGGSSQSPQPAPSGR